MRASTNWNWGKKEWVVTFESEEEAEAFYHMVNYAGENYLVGKGDHYRMSYDQFCKIRRAMHKVFKGCTKDEWKWERGGAKIQR